MEEPLRGDGTSLERIGRAVATLVEETGIRKKAKWRAALAKWSGEGPHIERVLDVAEMRGAPLEE